MADAFVIETTGLRKAYGRVDALRGLDLRVPTGSICGVLGRNGAGKTTTFKVLLGIVQPSGGAAHVFGLDALEEASSVVIRRRTAFVSEDKDLIDSMTVDEVVRFTASFFPQWRRDLEEDYRRKFALRGNARVKVLSRGARSKLALLVALCRRAELLLLDEPTAGLDPAAAEEVLQTLVAYVAGEPLTVCFSSHQLAEVEQIADHIAIVDGGRTVVAGALDDLRLAFRRIHVVFDSAAPDAQFRSSGVDRVRREGRVLTILARGNADAIMDEVRALKPRSIDAMPVTLKEMFFESIAGDR